VKQFYIRQNSDSVGSSEAEHFLVEKVRVSGTDHVCSPGERCTENRLIGWIP